MVLDVADEKLLRLFVVDAVRASNALWRPSAVPMVNSFAEERVDAVCDKVSVAASVAVFKIRLSVSFLS
jgi:hypothetical protein